MFENIILGFVQGITEWIPVGSKGLIFLIEKKFFHAQGFEEIIEKALFLHLGTFFAALIYFRKDVCQIFKTLFSYQKQSAEDQKLFTFLFISTLISGFLGIILVKTIEHLLIKFDAAGNLITIIVGALLLITAYLQIKTKTPGTKKIKDLKILDGIILGFAQGFAALPGLSRSGLTMSTLLLRQFDKKDTLKLSFLMSLPIVLAGNIVLNLKGFCWSMEMWAGLVTSFIVGLLTIHLFLKMAEKINFGYFLIVMGIIIISSAFI
ncbi:MAG TPA: undecaprenyl-diphosphate phosphatase [Candidatus Omnitrophota bacterium]|nr:undecaprenyl-diphosphate phosphatase [Candidatus Omnitrophota bacterium]HPN87783.1 undecaprenyl-diphosphate phosphatase [Candidatus Omnitrophota bacterium]